MKYLFSILLIFFFFNSNSQVTSRLTIESGSSVYFYINSFDKLENGMSYIDWTQLTVFYEDTAAVSTWTLDVGALSDKIYGGGTNELELATIELEVSGDIANTYPVPIRAPLVEQAVAKVLATGPETSSSSISISYYCGTNAIYKLLAKAPDYYTVDIQFTLYKTP